MGTTDSKLSFRKAVVQLTSKTQSIDSNDEVFWSQFWGESNTTAQDIFTLLPPAEIRAVREEAPANLATLCYKAVEKLVKAVDNSCRTQHEQQTALNCVRLLTRILPYIFEDSEWRGFFWSSLPSGAQNEDEERSAPLAQSLINAVCDLMFCPDFTVIGKKSGPDKAEELSAVDSCECIWEAGVGFAHSPPRVPAHDAARTELLKLLLTCFSETMYQPPLEIKVLPNKWIQYVTSAKNRHALPMFTSLLNTVCAYDPIGLGVPYNHLLFTDSAEPLVETALQVLIVTLDHDTSNEDENIVPDNLFINYLSRIHRDEDMQFVLAGFSRLLNNPLLQTYLPNSTKKVQFHQELLVFFWKFCDYNKKFLYYVLKSSDVLDILVPILYHLNDSRADQSRVGLMHIGVFILLLLSGERNFGVRLNKPYTATVPMDIPVFTGTHADLLIIVFHKVIATGHQRLQPLFDCLLTILVNVSPYLKTLSMVSSTKLLHLLEAFSTPWFLFSSPTNHQLVFFLLETFNNIIQYQFDGNSNLVYTIIRKRQVFHTLANLPTDHGSISKSLNKRNRKELQSISSNGVAESMEGSKPAQPAEPGTLKATLLETPGIEKMTEQESAHPIHGAQSPAEEPQPSGSADESSRCESRLEDDVFNESASSVVKENSVVKETSSNASAESDQPSKPVNRSVTQRGGLRVGDSLSPPGPNLAAWNPSVEWVATWKSKLPLQTIMRLLQVLVPQVEKICIDKGLTDESEILKFLQHGTLVGLLPVPHPILIRKYQANVGTTAWFRTYMWGVVYLRRLSKPMVTPVHRFQPIESRNGIPGRRIPPNPTVRTPSQPCIPSSISYGASRTTTDQIESGLYLDNGLVEHELNMAPRPRPGRLKYYVLALLCLVIVTVTAIKYYYSVQNQGAVDISIESSLSLLAAGLMVSCMLSGCRNKGPNPHFLATNTTPQLPAMAGTELEVPMPHARRDEVLLELHNASGSNVGPSATTSTSETLEQPPPPYHLAILLPPQETMVDDIPPPTYDKAVVR